MYSEEGNNVILGMSKEDYESLLIILGSAAGVAIRDGVDVDRCIAFMDRLNYGNPNYTPYQVEEKKS